MNEDFEYLLINSTENTLELSLNCERISWSQGRQLLVTILKVGNRGPSAPKESAAIPERKNEK